MAEATFIVKDNFQFDGLRRAGIVLIVPVEIVRAEIALGKHPETERPISGLLNHCAPADEATEALLTGFMETERPVKENPEESVATRKALMEEFDTLGIAFDRRWATERLRNELKKAKKEKGL